MSRNSLDLAPPSSSRMVPLGAGLSAVMTVLSCLPLSAATALGAVTLSTALTAYRWWFVSLSVVLVTAGFIQIYRLPPARRGVGSIALLAISAMFVLLVILANVIPH